ncbi:MAG: hypothetical protein WCO26_12055 [Deltaproteobacteria bacterium]
MNRNDRFLNMREAGAYMGQSYRWMQRNYVYLVKGGVSVFRVPKGSPKGHLVFERGGLDQYMESCRITADFATVE